MWGGFQGTALPGFRIAVAAASLVASLGAGAQVCTGSPSEARDLRLNGAGSTQLSWLPPTDAGGTQTVVYDILRSPAASGFASGYCVASDVTDLNGVDASAPAPLLFYLVRAKNGCGGTLGADSSGTPTVGTTCLFDNGGACLFDNECAGGACCSGFCRDLSNDPDHCGDCGTVCSADNVATRTCGGGVCNGACAAQFSNCDGNLGTNGCECAGDTCCPGSCSTLHTNGLGQSFSDCQPLGVPGNAATYSAALASEARAAWPFFGNDSTASCGTGPNAAFAAIRQTASSCAVWVYQKTLAGYVHLNSASSTCACPTASDPTWQ